MIYTQDGTVWVSCDSCKFTMFGGFEGASKEDVIMPLIKHGWTFRGKVLCSFCEQEKREKEAG